MVSFSLILPAYNEEQRIEKTLVALDNFFKCKDYDYEVFVVNDGSGDNTTTVVNNFIKNNDLNLELVEYKPNKGKGYAVFCGVKKAQKEIIAFLDADLPFELNLIDLSIKLIQNDDVEIVVGDRNDSRSSVNADYSFSRKLSGKIFSFLINLFLIKGFSDTQCGYKAFKNNVAKDIFSKQTIRGFGFDLEILFIANKRKYKVSKIPVIFSHSSNSKVKLIHHSWEMLMDIIRIKKNGHKEVYN